MGAADRHLQSWAMWELKTFCKEDAQSLSGDSQNAAFGSCKTGMVLNLMLNLCSVLCVRIDTAFSLSAVLNLLFSPLPHTPSISFLFYIHYYRLR